MPEVVVLVGPERLDRLDIVDGFASMLMGFVVGSVVVMLVLVGGVIGRHDRSIVRDEPFPRPTRKNPGWSGPGFKVWALVAGRGFEPLTFGL